MSLVDYQSSSDECEEEKSEIFKSDQVKVKESSKRKEPVKISVPTLNEFKDDESTPSKKPKNVSVAGLLGMLPSPKFSSYKGKTNMLIPDVLTRKKPESELKIKAAKPAASQSKPSKNEPTIMKSSTETDDSFGGQSSDFFSLESEPKESISQPIPSSFLRNALVSNCGGTYQTTTTPLETKAVFSGYSVKAESTSIYLNTEPLSSSQYYASPYEVQATGSTSTETQVAPTAYLPSDQSDITKDENFVRLQGKRRGGFENINFIDVTVDSQLADKTQWLTKPLTEEKNLFHSRKKNDMPTHQQKRKHQITYLAFQAKERELDLKNQWAHNRLTKRETQAKYGF